MVSDFAGVSDSFAMGGMMALADVVDKDPLLVVSLQPLALDSLLTPAITLLTHLKVVRPT